jgi:hypothetical protein
VPKGEAKNHFFAPTRAYPSFTQGRHIGIVLDEDSLFEFFFNSGPSGTFFHPPFTQLRMTPDLGFKGPGEPMPTAATSESESPLACKEALALSAIRVITFLAPKETCVGRLSRPKTFPLESTIAVTILVPPKSTPITFFTGPDSLFQILTTTGFSSRLCGGAL